MKRFFEAVGWVVFIGLVVAASEVAYLLKHRELSKIPVALNMWLGQQAAQRGNLEQAWEHFRVAGNAHQWYVSKLYPNKVPAQEELPADLPKAALVAEAFAKMIRTVNVGEMLQSELWFLAYYHYQLALSAAQAGDLELTKAFLTKATYLAPELSHFHVELANSNRIAGNVEAAEANLTQCRQFTWPTQHCEDFARVLRTEAQFPVGFLKQEIRNYYRLPPSD